MARIDWSDERDRLWASVLGVFAPRRSWRLDLFIRRNIVFPENPVQASVTSTWCDVARVSTVTPSVSPRSPSPAGRARRSRYGHRRIFLAGPGSRCLVRWAAGGAMSFCHARRHSGRSGGRRGDVDAQLPGAADGRRARRSTRHRREHLLAVGAMAAALGLTGGVLLVTDFSWRWNLFPVNLPSRGPRSLGARSAWCSGSPGSVRGFRTCSAH